MTRRSVQRRKKLYSEIVLDELTQEGRVTGRVKGESLATEPTVIQSTRSRKENKKDTEGGDGTQPNSKFVRSKIQNV